MSQGTWSSCGRSARPGIAAITARSSGPTPTSSSWRSADPNRALGAGCRAWPRAGAKWLSGWEDFRQEADEYRELDDERVLVLFRMFGRGKTSGFDLAQMHPLSAGVFHIRDGRVTRFVGYFDHERALEAVGLRE